MAALRSCFPRTQTWQQAGKYVSALVSDLPKRNGWTTAEHAGDRGPDRMQRLLNRASWDAPAAISEVRRFAWAGLEKAAQRGRRRGGLVIAAIDETGQQKTGAATAGVKRQYNGLRRPGGERDQYGARVAGAGEGRALPDRRAAVDRPRAHRRPGDVTGHGPAAGPGVPYQGAAGHGHLRGLPRRRAVLRLCLRGRGYGSCTKLREFFEDNRQAYVLRVASNFMITLAPGTRMTCADAVNRLLKDRRRWEVRSAGKGSRGERWYAWAWIAAASPRHHLLVRRHLKTGELAFHYCYVPEGQLLTKTRLVRAAGLRWPVEEDFRLGKDCLGLDECQARLYTAIQRHIVLVMAALAICAVTAARLKDRTDARPAARGARPGPAARPGNDPADRPGDKTPAGSRTRPRLPVGHAARWLAWRRRHQARARWFHQRTRLNREYNLVS